MGLERFAGKVVWVTGASSGIGRALARAFDRAGARLILSGRDEAALEAVRQGCRLPGDVHLVPFDLGSQELISGQVDVVLARWGHVDYMVHNAGVALRGRMAETPLDLDHRVMATNYFGPLALTKALLPSMLDRGSGHFVVISSLSGKYGVPQLSAYAASKHALHGAFESLRAEVHGQGLRVTMVVPGIIRTPILEHALTSSGARYGKTTPEYAHGMDPGDCAARILRAVAREREEVLVGKSEIFTVYLKRFAPTLLSAFVRSHPVRWQRNLRQWLSFGGTGGDT